MRKRSGCQQANPDPHAARRSPGRVSLSHTRAVAFSAALTTHRLRNHGLVVVLQAVREDEDGHEALVDLAHEHLLLGRRPVQVAVVGGEHLHRLVLVRGVDVLVRFGDDGLDALLRLVVRRGRGPDVLLRVGAGFLRHGGLR